MPTGAGKFPHLMTFERNTPSTRDAQNQPIPNWAAIVGTPSWVSIEPLSGRELWMAQQVQGDVTHRIRVRYNAALALTNRDRGLYQSRIFNFVAVKNLEERNIEWEILAVEQTA